MLPVFAGDGEKRADAISLLEAVLLNFQSLQQFDLLMQIESSWTSDAAPIYEELVNVRLMIDSVNHRYLGIERGMARTLVRPAEKVSEQRSDSLIAAIGVDRTCTLRMQPKIVRRFTDFRDAFYFLRNVPDINNIGIYGFPAGFRTNANEARLHEKQRQISNINDVQYNDTLCVIEIQDHARGKRIINLNVADLTLESIKETIVLNDGSEIVRRSEQYHFEDYGGIKLPVKVVIEQAGSRDFNSKRIRGITMTIADCKWRKVNEDLSKDEFDFAVLGDDNALLRLVEWNRDDELGKANVDYIKPSGQ